MIPIRFGCSMRVNYFDKFDIELSLLGPKSNHYRPCKNFDPNIYQPCAQFWRPFVEPLHSLFSNLQLFTEAFFPGTRYWCNFNRQLGTQYVSQNFYTVDFHHSHPLNYLSTRDVFQNGPSSRSSRAK